MSGEVTWEQPPSTSPWRLLGQGWRDVARRLRVELEEDNISVVAAGMAFFMLMALLPLFALLIAVYGLVMDPALVEQQIEVLGTLVPKPAWQIIAAGLTKLSSQTPAVLGFGFVFGVAGSAWAVSSGALMMIRGLNIAYDQRETRGFLRLRWLSLKLMVFILLFGALAFSLLAVLPVAIDWLGLPAGPRLVAQLTRWPLMLLTAIFGLELMYRLTPNRPKGTGWRWISPGSLLATVVWLLGSALFALYVDRAGNYDKLYGALGGVVVFMLWLYMSAYCVLLGAELNAEIERQATR
jgi:membrane protein